MKPTKKIKIRIPVPSRGVVPHRPKRGKGSYRRKPKHKHPTQDNQ